MAQLVEWWVDRENVHGSRPCPANLLHDGARSHTVNPSLAVYCLHTSCTSLFPSSLYPSLSISLSFCLGLSLPPPSLSLFLSPSLSLALSHLISISCFYLFLFISLLISSTLSHLQIIIMMPKSLTLRRGTCPLRDLKTAE